jgi:hypothetical protein
MISKPFVFLSSTSTLGEERGQLKEKLPRVYELYLFEEDRARGASPEAHCERRIGQSDVFVSILGPDYGSVTPDGLRSIVEWEHDIAAKRPDLESMGFVKVVDPGVTRDPRQQALIDRLSRFRGGSWLKTYRTPDQLVSCVRASLEHWLAEVFAAVRSRRAELRKAFLLPLSALPVACVLGLVVLAVLSGAAGLTRSAMIGLCVAVEVIVMLCGTLLLWLGWRLT